MANLAISGLGAGVGYLIGGPTGAQLGWMAGQMYTASKQTIRQPAVGDLRIQTAQYGVVIPKVIGMQRVAPNIIWASPKRPYTITTRSKGAPTQEATGYKMDMALLLCEGPIVGVRRVWANNNLIIDGSGIKFGTITGGSGYKNGIYNDVPMTGGSGTGMKCRVYVTNGSVSAVSVMESGSGYAANNVLSASNTNLGGSGSGFSIVVKSAYSSVAGLGKLYLGTADQLQDPTMVAALGANNVPAYRGLAYMVLTDFNLGTSGAIPNFSFEIYGTQGF